MWIRPVATAATKGVWTSEAILTIGFVWEERWGSGWLIIQWAERLFSKRFLNHFCKVCGTKRQSLWTIQSILLDKAQWARFLCTWTSVPNFPLTLFISNGKKLIISRNLTPKPEQMITCNLSSTAFDWKPQNLLGLAAFPNLFSSFVRCGSQCIPLYC